MAERETPPTPVPAGALALVSLAVVLLEVSYTRVFSFKLYYYFTYLIIGIALLGGGTGGLLLATTRRLQAAAPARLFAVACLVAGATVLAGYWVVAHTQLNAGVLARAVKLEKVLVPKAALAEGAKLVLICASLFAPFLAAGLAIAKVFASRPQEIGRLYFADLLGAGIGCAAAVPLLYVLSPPACVQLAGALAVLAALYAAAGMPRLRLAAAGLLVPLVALVAFPPLLPEPIPDREKTLAHLDKFGVELGLSRWNPVFRVDVFPSPVDPNVMVIAHDGMWGAIMRRFDGDPASLGFFDTDVRSFPFRVLGPKPAVAIIGAAGGHEVLASRYFDARHVTGIELNPVSVSLLTDHYADFTGHLADDPRVTLVNAEARSFLGRHGGIYDLVWFVAPDSYAAMNAATAGAFVLSESYLYTAEMVRLALDHLSDDGVVCAQFGELDYAGKPLRTARYLATAREAYRRMGITDFGRHVLVATTSAGGPVYSTVLLKKQPFTAAEVERFVAAAAAIEGSVVRYPSEAERDAAASRVIDLPPAELAAWYRRYPFELRPVTDETPFFWHFVRFRDALRAEGVAFDPEQAVGERLLLVLLAVATLFATVCLLGPLAYRRAAWAGIPYALRLGLYFAAVGLGFILLEVGLIQRLTLFLGYPTHTLSVTLCTLLVSTGIGSLLAPRDGSPARTLAPAATVLGAIVLFYCFGLGALLARVNVASFPVRVLVAVGVIFPLGLCLGRFMPVGLRTMAALSDRPAAHVAWAWGVNGFFSVVGSVLATMLSMALGFRAVFLVAGAAYGLAVAALWLTPRPDAGRG